MEQRTLGRSELSTGRVVFGTMTFGSQVDLAEASRVVDACREAGVTMFDTANSYNDGESERMLGRVLAPMRDEVLVATKVGNRTGPGPDDAGLSKAAITKAIDASLRRLGTDHVDLYYLHLPDWGTPIEQTLEALDDLVQTGKVRYGASSNYAAWEMAEMHGLARRHGWQALHVSQPLYNLLARRLEDEYAAFSQRFTLSNIVYNPLAGGLLSGKHRPGTAPGAGTRFTLEHYRRRYWNDAQFAAVASLREAAAGAGLSLIELAFRWLLSRPLVDAVLVGASNLDQLAANLAACQTPTLDQPVADRCDEVWATLRGAAPRYNR
ncbi:MAG: aldo/keto reductase [Egibacteraceae bacterium]